MVEERPSREATILLEKMVSDRERKYIRSLALPHSLLHFHLVSMNLILGCNREVVVKSRASVFERTGV